MRILSWNMRGGNFPSKKQVICEMCYKHNPDILMLQETKVQERNQERFKNKIWGEVKFQAIHARGKLGGLGIYVDPQTISIENVFLDNRRCLMVRVIVLKINFSFFLINVYAPNKFKKRKKF